MTTNRQFAILEGHPTYEGKACPVCSRYEMLATSTRYTASGACVACQRRRGATRPDGTRREPMSSEDINDRMMSTELRLIAAQNGDREYEGKACKRCGNRSRYVSNGACKVCVKASASALREKLQAATHTPQPQPFSTGGKSSCTHAAIFSRMEYLNGHDVRYVRCDITKNIMDSRPALGKCVLCHPNQLITFFNSYQARQIVGLDQLSVRILYDLCANDQLSGVQGRSVASLCLAAKADRLAAARGTVYREPQIAGLPVPPPAAAPTVHQVLTLPGALPLPGIEDTDID